MAAKRNAQRGAGRPKPRRLRPGWPWLDWLARHRLRAGAALMLLGWFAAGLYLGDLYGNISALIAQRRAALTSAIYSAPMVIAPGEDIVRLHLGDRLARLSYTLVPEAAAPGEYSATPAGVTIYRRAFVYGVRNYAAALARVSLRGTTVNAVRGADGAPLGRLTLEPEVIGRLMPNAPAERTDVRLGELPHYLVGGLLATEDRFFYWHFGFDPIRMVEAAAIDLYSHRLRQGASTITQQLARTFMRRRDRTFGRKFKEAAVALVLEARLTKRQILQRYINDVPLGEYDGTAIEGMPLAARYLFNKDLREVSPAEAAMLIGMIRGPSEYDPRRHPRAARARRDTVLAIMRRAGVINAEQYAEAIAAPLALVRPAGVRRAPYFDDYVTAFVKRIPGFDGDLTGVKVYTTLDPEMQDAARAAVLENLDRLERAHPWLGRGGPDAPLESSLVAIDAQNGAIRAMVGGRDYAKSQFNRAAQAERQVGSAFKPVVYLAALDPALSPFRPPLTLASVLPDRPMSFGGWAPVDYERTWRGSVTAADALADSLNLPTAWIGNALGPARMIAAAHMLGIHEALPAVLPISIGAGDTTLLELTSVYQVFADGGIKAPPWAVASVVDRRGHLIYRHAPEARRVISPQAAFLMTGALENVLRYGTGAGAARMGLDFPAAGKTGTTDDYHDGYFVGYTPHLVCGVWTGFDHPRSIGLPGAEAALPAWVDFMKAARRESGARFRVPHGIVMEAIDPASGGLATPWCPRAVTVPFLLGTQPRDFCRLHGGGVAAGAPTAAPRLSAGGAGARASAPPAENGLFAGLARLFGMRSGK